MTPHGRAEKIANALDDEDLLDTMNFNDDAVEGVKERATALIGRILTMIETKTFELRDVGTFIPVVAMRIAPFELPSDSADRYLMRRAGYGDPLILLTRLDGDGTKAFCDPYDWGDRTWQTAHHFIERHWFGLASGAVVDVEFILGQRDAPKRSEREEMPL